MLSKAALVAAVALVPSSEAALEGLKFEDILKGNPFDGDLKGLREATFGSEFSGGVLFPSLKKAQEGTGKTELDYVGIGEGLLEALQRMTEGFKQIPGYSESQDKLDYVDLVGKKGPLPSVSGVLGESGCVPLGGLKDGSLSADNEAYLRTVYTALPFGPIVATASAGVIAALYETPPQIRIQGINSIAGYTALAGFDETAIGWFGETTRYCTKGLTKEEKALYEKITGALVTHYVYFAQAPKKSGGQEAIRASVAYGGLKKAYRLMEEYDPASCDFSKKENQPATPWSIAKCACVKSLSYFETDGWNSDGSLSREVNRKPFEDFDFFDGTNQYNKYENQLCTPNSDVMTWTPLREDSGVGFFQRSLHVTPQIGLTSRLLTVPSENKCSYLENETVPDPQYDYDFELDFVLEETRKTANDNKRFVEVEAFDSKLSSLVAQAVLWGVANKLSEFEHWKLALTFSITMHDATVLAWREKVYWNLIRPTTVAERLGGTERKSTWAGGDVLGEREIKVVEWEPVIRTMPHAEYPSGSACMCKAWAEALTAFSGSDEVNKPSPALDIVVKKGQSKIAPHVRPTEDVRLTFSRWSQIAETCSVSRTAGGMHFSKALDVSADMCEDVGGRAFGIVQDLAAGERGGGPEEGNLKLVD
uniref:Vanadium-dependent haloperoxidase NapH1-like second helical-bundle domain-containing protein n=1 Tax=Chromera velia CCMP2878 TaxID=1169474 RepID=A0A0G4IDW2_9ALVE|eukprot:Cvel_13409.t1-p1 / transcript=Cvel_13409.t1 / gene=Cvel_13409 / organism=Chromera_velia_CCMP2878 / gene_product=hypothetical protein / transcript_product=hypothetical protein / location=Cvel_scaffold914:18637-25173(+) / protein_length=648 / sequence_SO=supercontig / SO=protein_coding / is_pseudo=false